ncbi:MAG: dynamin family protein [Candidatus Cloacimonadales bacterium]|jgi:GTPase Era involved in 16S rRNA processing/vacuolar-type H+-ATPase subunit H|nr:dynamin family protein [Candidatus Cloacimonadales bacterium]
MKNKLISLLNDKNFSQLIRKHRQESRSESIQESLDKFIDVLKQDDCRISVLGSQGSGKSTFLNALLLDDTILPVDVDETTCIPVEMKYTNEEQLKATVFYQNGNSLEVPATEEGLKPYVHQVDNPDNTKEIDRIVLHSNNKLLKSGLVLVDLPGVGSLSQKNQKTTYNYIKESAAAIYLLRTNPPIDQTDKVMIQLTLPLITKTFFVQNQWVDETAAEVEDGKLYNLERLSDLAKLNNHSEKDIDIRVINVHKALIGKLHDDQKKIDESKIKPFFDVLISFSEKWKQSIIESIRDKTKSFVVDSINVIQEQRRITDLNLQDAIKEITAKEDVFKKEFDNNKKIADDCLQFIRNEKYKIIEEIETVAHHAYSQLRNSIREEIQRGLVSSDMVRNALQNHINEQNDFVFYEINPSIIALLESISHRISQLGDFSFEKGQIASNVSVSDKSKVHSFYAPIAGLAGAVGGALGGASLGATFGSAFGPVGSIIGGVLGGLLGSFLGNRAKTVHLDQQKRQTWSEVEPYTNAFKDNIIQAYNKQLDKLYTDINREINNWHKNNKNEFESYIDALKKDIQKTDQEKSNFIQMLNTDQAILEKYLREMEM